MREKWQKQMPLMPQIKEHTQAKELKAISDIIDVHPIICNRVLQDLNKGKLPTQFRLTPKPNGKMMPRLPISNV